MTARRARSVCFGLLSLVAVGAPVGAVACGAPSPPPPSVVDDDVPDGAAPDLRIVSLDAPREKSVGGAPVDGGPVECQRDADCQNGLFCDGYEVCGPMQRCVPARPIECPALLPICDEDVDTCTCTMSSCPAPSSCDGFTCM